MKNLKKIQLLFICVLFTFKTFGQETIYGAAGSDVVVPNWPIAECFGTTQNLHDFLNEGKVVIVYYADTWCGICKDKARKSLTSQIIKDWKAKYPNKIEFLAAFNGPTDCNGVRNAKNDYGWGSEIKAFVCNGDSKNKNTAKFFSWGAPGFSIIDSKTKKIIYTTYNNGELDGGLRALQEVMNGTYKILDASVNLAYRKPITNIFPEKENPFEPIGCVNDGIAGTTYQPYGWNPTGFIIDLGGQANITGFKSYFQESNGPDSYTVATSNSSTGPWEDIPGNFGSKGVNTISNISRQGRFIKWQSPGKGWFSEFTVDGKMLITDVEDLNSITTSYSIYPNPAHDLLNVKLSFNQSSDVKISIVDLLGQEVIQVQNGVTNEVIKIVDLTNITPGFYMVSTFVNGTKLKSIKLTVN